ncbi:hypothetical protein CMUS01_13597 [Colletotrichum musicola]|uniref:Fungal N-terminal domain-containing protein n=1 Tax=Colletotrichum musicola TaxID=2175873 RepID=A0A8H6JBW0_9PEZI|nr:hypothetical protein CMUS01_13597 [Colletotrichum musicola]
MAEALGLASSVIAIVDVTGKALALSFKLKSLWDEVRDAPALLLEKAEELQDLEDFFLDAETQAATTPIPKSLWNDAMIQKSIGKARAAMRDLQDSIDSLGVQVNDKRRHRRTLAAAKVVIKKDSLEAMERKLNRALSLYRMAQGLYCAKPFLYQPTATKSYVSEISKGSSFFGRIRFGFGGSSWSLSMRTPSWLAGTVYSVMCQRCAIGWQLNLASYEVIESILPVFIDIMWSDDLTALQKHLRERALTPLVHDYNGRNLLHVSVSFFYLT